MTKDDFDSWSEWTVTKEIIKYLQRRQEAEKSRLIDLSCSNDPNLVGMVAARTSGFVSGIDEIITLVYEDLVNEA